MDYWFRNMIRKRFAAAIEYLIANPEQARRFGDRGREIAREKFSIETSGRALRALFENTARRDVLPHVRRPRCDAIRHSAACRSTALRTKLPLILLLP